MFAFCKLGRCVVSLLVILTLTPASHRLSAIDRDQIGNIDPRPLPDGFTGDSFFREKPFLRADANDDGTVDISDSIHTLTGLFNSNVGAFPCANAADSNRDRRLDVSDPIFTLNWLFAGGPEPPAPGPHVCGVDRGERALPCDSYESCPDELPLIAHVLNRITFGPTEELYTRIQTRSDLLEYIDEQLAAPENYDAAVHEPELAQVIEDLDFGFGANANPGQQIARLGGTLVVHATRSDFQLLHVVAQFWNNHFHTQVNALRQNFFSRGGRGGGALLGTDEMFNAADTDASNGLTEAEWTAFQTLHPGAMDWTNFGRNRIADGVITREEFFDRRVVAFWKYAGGREQFGISADMEWREYRSFRRRTFGPFRDLLAASAKSVAMVIYLNGFENTAESPNENYAREVKELSTLGADAVYTQRDIEETARLLTGWTVAWVDRSVYSKDDVNFVGHPESFPVPINLREPPPFRFPTQANWEDEEYTWAFVINVRQHDWTRKDIFLQRYGGVDTLGNPVSPADELSIPANTTNRTVEAALEEFGVYADRLVSFRDTAKFVGTKLIQLFVTDDLSQLAKTYDMPADLRSAFDSVDLDGSGMLDLEEWLEPVPLVLPNGRPPDIFDTLDENGDGLVTPMEYQEPDLLLDVIETWRSTNGEIREVLRTILHSEEFLSLKFYRAKVKSPFELVVSALRGLGAEFTRVQLEQTIADILLAGMELYQFADPTGESEFGFDWMHTIGLLERLKYVSRATNPLAGNQSRTTWNPGGAAATWGLNNVERLVDFYSLLLLNGDILDNQRELARQTFTSAPNSAARATVAFLLSLPQFQKQ